MPHIVTVTAGIKALKQLQVQHISLARLLLPQLPKRAIVFLEAKGFEVVRLQSLNLTDNIKIGQLPLKLPRP